MRRWLIAALGAALFLGQATTAAAQQVEEEATSEATPNEDRPGSFHIGLGIGDDALSGGSDRNTAFGHSGATFHVAPSLATRFGHFGLFGATLRLDANDGLYEFGVPLMAQVGIEREGRVNISLEINGGFDHLGAAMLIGDPGQVAFTMQRTMDMRLGFERHRLRWGISAGEKHYSTRFAEVDPYARQWRFMRAWVGFQVRPRLALGASSQLQLWDQTSPGDRMREGERSLTHEVSASAKVTDEVTLRAHGGIRQDTPSATHRPFAGVEATWSPTFGKKKYRARAAPSSDTAPSCSKEGQEVARCEGSEVGEGHESKPQPK